MEFLQKILTS